MSVITCQYCEVEFRSKRNTAKFCKPSHRVAYNRLPARIEGLMNASLGRMRDIDDLAKKHPTTLHLAISAMMTAENYTEHKRLKLQELVREQS